MNYEQYFGKKVNVQEAICLMEDKINEIVEMMNRVDADHVIIAEKVKEMEKLIDYLLGAGLAAEVIKRLQEWLADGTLAGIINETIFKDITDKIKVLTDRLDAVEYVMPRPVEPETNRLNLQKLLNIGLVRPVKIKFNPGTWEFDKTLNIFSNTTIEMNKETVLKGPKSLTFMTGRAYNTIDGALTGYDGYSNIKFTGGTIVGHFISMIHTDGFIAEGVSLKDCPLDHYMEIAGCRNVRLTNCSFKGMRTPAAGREYVEYIQIDSPTRPGFPRWDEGSACFDGIGNENIVIEDCSFGNKGSNADFNYLGCAIGSHGSQEANKFHNKIRITNCDISGWSYAALRLFTSRNALVENNIFGETNRKDGLTCFGVRLYDNKDAQIKGNIFRGCQISTTRVIDNTGADGCTIINNKCLNVTSNYSTGVYQFVNTYNIADGTQSKNITLGDNIVSPAIDKMYNAETGIGMDIYEAKAGYDLIFNGSQDAGTNVPLLEDISKYSLLYITTGGVSTGDFITNVAVPFNTQKFSAAAGNHSKIAFISSELKKCVITIKDGDMSIDYQAESGLSQKLRQIYGMKRL